MQQLLFSCLKQTRKIQSEKKHNIQRRHCWSEFLFGSVYLYEKKKKKKTSSKYLLL